MNHLMFCGIFVTCCAVAAYSQSGPEQLLNERMRTPLLRVEGTLTGESLCWHAAYNMHKFMAGYRESRDTAYLSAGVKYYDALIATMHTSPDGYKGWVGPFIYDEKYICDVHIGDAILINPMLDFAEIVLAHEDAAIREEYAQKVQDYLELAKKHLIEKWDSRNTWREYRDYGGYISWDRYMTSNNLHQWRRLPVEKSNLSLPFNKQNSMGIACLRIYRITGENEYLQKALKIFNFMKSRMCLFDDHYVWNYWEPLGPWDVDADEPNKLRHWVNVHPYRNYQAGEVHEIVEAYHSGVTFTAEDIQRIINTNLKVMWNGDLKNPKWRNSNHAVLHAALGTVPVVKLRGDFKGFAGTLWSGLVDFDSTIRQLAGYRPESPPSFNRKYPELPITTFSVPFSSNRYLVMAAVIPSVVTKGSDAFIISKSRVPGDIEIALFSADGRRKVLDIHRTNGSGQPRLLVLRWDGSHAPAGMYRIRWTLRCEYREFPVVVINNEG